jgi:hypothetical protein
VLPPVRCLESSAVRGMYRTDYCCISHSLLVLRPCLVGSPGGGLFVLVARLVANPPFSPFSPGLPPSPPSGLAFRSGFASCAPQTVVGAFLTRADSA